VVWSFAVADYGFTKEGKPVIYELQPFITLMPHQDKIQSMWSVLGVDSDHGDDYLRKNFTVIFKALGLSEKGTLLFHNDPAMLSNKRLQRQWMKSKEELKPFNPPFITYDFLRPLTNRVAELHQLFDETKKITGDDVPSFVIKLPSSTRGEGNFFFQVTSKEEFAESLSALINKSTYVETDHLGRKTKLSLKDYSGQVLIEGCVNATNKEIGVKETSRLLIAHDGETIHLLPTTQCQHRSYDSHKKIKRLDQVTGFSYDVEHNSVETLREELPLTDPVRKAFETIAKELSLYLNKGAVSTTAHVNYIKAADYDFTHRPTVNVSSVTGDVMAMTRLLQGAVYSKVKPKIIGQGAIEKELRLASLLSVESYNGVLAEFILNQLGKLYFPIDESHWYSSESLVHFLGHINKQEKKGGKSIKRVMELKRRLLECEYGVKDARQYLPLPLTPDRLIKTCINVSLRRAVNQLRENAHRYEYHAERLVTDLHSVPVFKRISSHYDEVVENEFSQVEKMLKLEKTPEKNFFKVINQLKAIEARLVKTNKAQPSTYLLQAVAMVSNQLNSQATTTEWLGHYVVNQLEQHVKDVEVVMSVTSSEKETKIALPSQVNDREGLMAYRERLYEWELMLYPKIKKMRSWTRSHHPRFSQLASSLEDIRYCLVLLGVSCLTRAQLHQHFRVSQSQPVLLYKDTGNERVIRKNR